VIGADEGPEGGIDPGTLRDDDRRRLLRWSAAGLALLALCVVIAALPPDSPAGIVLPLAVEIVAVVVFALRGQRRRVWRLLWTAMLLVVVGDVVYAFQDHVLDAVPFPGWADWAYLASYVPQALAIALLIRARHRRSLAQVLDTLIMSVPVLTVTVVYVVTPLVTGDGWDAATFVSILYPLADVAILIGIIRLLVGAGRMNRSLALLAASVSTTLIADLVYSGLVVQGVVDDQPGWVQALFTLGVVLMTAAALSRDAATADVPAPAGARRLMSPARSASLAVASVALPVMIVLGLGTGAPTDDAALAIGAVVVNVLIVWRVTTLLGVIRQQRDELDRLARTDSLTGLPNRRSWEFECRRVEDRLRRGGTAVVAMLDLDHFKRFNDSHGHQRGDALLRAAADAWSESLPASAYLARYGGEEFALLLPDTRGPEALPVLEALRLATPPGTTVSIGYAVAAQGAPLQLAVASADAALYRAKSLGRNRVAAAR